MTIMSSVSLKNVSSMSSKLADIKGMNVSFLVASVLVLIGLTLAIVFIRNNESKEDKELSEKLA